MDLTKFVQHPAFIRFTVWLANTLSEKSAHRLLWFLAGVMVRRKPRVYRIVKANFSHFPGMSGNPQKLDALTKQMFFNGGRFYYDHYRYLGSSVEELSNAVNIPEEYLSHIKEAINRGQGVLLLGMHSGNFDLGAMAVASKGFPIQLLSLAAPSEGFKLMNDFRAKVGFEVTPITPAVLRNAISRIRSGGVAATALDWPHPEDGTPLKVFGDPSYAPLGAARLACLTGALVMVVCFYLDPVEGYKIHNLPPVELVSTGSRNENIRVNAEKFIQIFEKLVVQHPDQWMMYHPFWPMEDEEEAS